MPSLRGEITRTFLRLSRRKSSGAPGPRPSVSERVGLLQEGSELGPYRVLKLLGSGGMGQVYLALDTHLHRKVALKLFDSALTADPNLLRRFQQEARTASALNHPNILTILGFPEISGRQVLISEFIEGQTLRDALAQKLELPLVLEIISQVASALAAAHSAGVIHRDLKPSNIMIRPDGYVKVIDFGLAKLTQRVPGDRSAFESATLPGVVLGTIGYMSPEQARGEEADERSDVWSLGVILYEMVARTRPFEGSTESHVIVAILDAAPRPIPADQKIPSELRAVIECALQKDRKARYQSAAEMLGDIERVRDALGVPGRRTSIPIPKRRRTFYPALLAGIVMILAGVLIWWWPLGGRWKILRPQWFEIATSRRLTFVGNLTLASISPDGEALAYVAGSSGREQLRLLNLKTNAERQLPAVPDHYLGLTFSPDSRTLFYVLKNVQQERGQLFSIRAGAIESEPPALVLEDLEGPITFSPDGSRFAFVRGRADNGQDLNQILVGAESNARNATPIVSVYGTQIHERLAWSSNDKWLAAIGYPSRLNQITRASLFLYEPTGKLIRTFAPSTFRKLQEPVSLDGGSLLLFAGTPQGGEQDRLAQLFTPTGEIRQLGANLLGFQSLSVTSDSKAIAAVQLDERSSIWMADVNEMQSARKLTPDSEKLSSLDWLGGDEIVFPSARTGNVNLMRLLPDGSISSLGRKEGCLQEQPVSVPGSTAVVYASNCAHLGDDFHIWSIAGPSAPPRALTSGSNYDYQPDVSPDGKWVYYTSWTSNIPSIWRVPLAGGAPSRVLQNQALMPVVSPDSTKLVCTVREDHGRWTVAIVSTQDGSVLQQLPRLPIQRPIRWSPDGMSLDFVNEDQTSWGIWRQPLPMGDRHVLLRVPEGTIPSFAWNRSGTKLAFIRARDQKDAVLFSRATKN